MIDLVFWLVLALAVVVVGILVVASRRPDTFRTARSLSMAAPPEAISRIVADPRRFPEWSPWQKNDPAQRATYSGPPTGVGAVTEWEGNSKVGAGRTEILEASTSQIVMRLEMKKPMKADNRVQFSFEPKGGATDVTWAMSGRQPLMGKVFGLFVDCEAMVGRDFEAGLANLKAIVERR